MTYLGFWILAFITLGFLFIWVNAMCWLSDLKD